ncbi:MAG: PQQ-dependent sugar dehydrogenase [Cryomorphaceae bacterium]|nr:PQQ-dependent sugar dehydrogenase [Flavobacteriales bacterium]
MKKLLLVSIFLPLLASAQVELELDLMADGFNRPCDIVNAGDERLFVVEQVGTIQILHQNGDVEEEPFLDISSIVESTQGEQGLLGLAFAPDYCTSGEFYVNYTQADGNQTKTVIARYNVSPEDPNDALEDSEEVLLEYDQDFSNHNGGQIEFGPEGYLYIASGDGGSAGDPNNRAQDIMSYLGKILRIDVSTDPYSIPEDNPFAFDDFGLDEIWAYGLRNPWKFAFDDANGDLYIGDVGQSNREEIDFQAAGTPGGLNFGWRCYEGNETYNTTDCLPEENYEFPIFDYAYGNQGNGFRCSITGGRVYRGPSFEQIQGKYIATDFCSGEYWVTSNQDGEWETTEHSGLVSNLVAFGADVWGEMYAVQGQSSGRVYRVSESSNELLNHIVLAGTNSIESTLQLDGASYTWYYEGELVDGANDPQIDVLFSGLYQVIITTETGCSITSNEVNIIVSSTNDSELVSELDVFPNPTSGMVNLSITLLDNNADLMVGVYDLSGREVKSEHITTGGNQSLNLSELSGGIYLIRFYDDTHGVLATRKLVLTD